MPGKPFSGKQKKKQLQERREKKRTKDGHNDSGDGSDHSGQSSGPEEAAAAPRDVYGGDKPGVRSQFQRESRQDVEARRRSAYAPLLHRDFIDPAVGIPFGRWFVIPGASDTKAVVHSGVPVGEGACSVTFPYSLALPRRAVPICEATKGPDGTSKEAFEQREAAHFNAWAAAIDATFAPSRDGPRPASHPLQGLELNLFERNIDVWRQLWRTVEHSDVAVVVADARYPIVHLPPALFVHIVGVHHKPVVIVLNKVDLVTDAFLERWVAFLKAHLRTVVQPLVPPEHRALLADVPILKFTCLPVAGTAMAASLGSGRQKKKKRNAKLYEELKSGRSRRGQNDLAQELGVAESDDSDDSTRQRGKQRHPTKAAARADSSDEEDRPELGIVHGMIETILAACRRVAPPDAAGHVHIGLIGHPNVGKSSLINCLVGTKAVSVSATAGHTKHLQTLPMPDDGLTLIDCPGLAFPALGVPRPMQAVLGTHQIAQTRDPQSGIGYLGSRLQLERIYNLRRVDNDDEEPWSAYDLCESYGEKKGFRVKHGKGSIDIHRAAIAILTEAYEGRLVLSFAPPPADLHATPGFATLQPLLYIDVDPLVAAPDVPSQVLVN